MQSNFNLKFIKNPFPYYYCDNALNNEVATKIQQEILEADISLFDRYENPFEKKWTYRDKNKMPPSCSKLFKHLESDEFINKLSKMVGMQLYKDPTKNWHGIHKYDNGDKLDIHVDAGIHPCNMKKEITLGIYLSKNWKEENGGHLEIWEGENASNNDAKLVKCCNKLLPIFNRMVIFSCDDYSWHGNPHPVKCSNNETRIFLTMSYLSKRPLDEYKNHRKKAFFIAIPGEMKNVEKDKLRLLRADENKCKDVYNISSEKNF